MKASKKRLIETKKHEHDRKNMLLLAGTFLAVVLFIYLA